MDNDIVKFHPAQLEMIPIKDVKKWHQNFVKLSKSLMKEGLDYGTIPGTDKPCLYKAGAEKLRFVYGLTVEIECIDKMLILEAGNLYVDYTYKATVRSSAGQILTQCEGSCNTREAKYRWGWLVRDVNPQRDEVSLIVAKKMGKWIKGKDNIWRFFDKVENPETIGLKNTVMKMAQKRAYVGAILLATGASEFYTQDMEEDEFSKDDATQGPELTPEEEEIKQKWIVALNKIKTLEQMVVFRTDNQERITAPVEKLILAREHEIKNPKAADKAKAAVKDLAGKMAIKA
jgi:hypothetical protein